MVPLPANTKSAMTAACRADAFLSVQDYTDKLLSDYNA